MNGSSSSMVADTCSACCVVLVFQLPEYIGCDIVDLEQTEVGTVHEMTTCSFLLPKQRAQLIRQLVCCSSSNIQLNFHSLPKLSQNGLQERHYDTAVNLMHGITHVHYDVDIHNALASLRILDGTIPRHAKHCAPVILFLL
jgi:hypothetical protein